MPDLTTRLQLKKPVGSDPFLRQDFRDNYDILESYPGIYLCDSSTLPAWGTAQAGLTVLESDTKRLRRWTGSTWENLTTYPDSYYGSIDPGASVTNGGQGTWTVMTVNVTRACRLMIQGSVRISIPDGTYDAHGNINTYVDGTSAEVGGNGYFDFGKTPDYQVGVFPTFGARVVDPGSHTIAFHVDMVGGNAPTYTVKRLVATVIATEAT